MNRRTFLAALGGLATAAILRPAARVVGRSPVAAPTEREDDEIFVVPVRRSPRSMEISLANTVNAVPFRGRPAGTVLFTGTCWDSERPDWTELNFAYKPQGWSMWSIIAVRGGTPMRFDLYPAADLNQLLAT